MNGLCTMLEPGNVPRARSVVKLRFAVSRLPPRHQRYQKRRASSYKAKEFLERNGCLVTHAGRELRRGQGPSPRGVSSGE